MECAIRNATMQDYNQIDSLMQQVHKLHCDERPDIYCYVNHVYSELEYKQLIDNENVIVLLAESGEQIVAICIVTIKNTPKNPVLIPHKTAYIEDFCVQHQYQEKGIGSILFAELERKMRLNGVQRIDLTVWSFNKQAISFYEKNDMNCQRIIMEKYL